MSKTFRNKLKIQARKGKYKKPVDPKKLKSRGKLSSKATKAKSRRA